MRNREIPLDLVADILSRMSVKDVLRFRLVDRAFCDLIDSPQFVKLHLMRATARRAEVSLVYQIRSNLYSSDINYLARRTRWFLDCHVPFRRYRYMRFLGSCNGLLLIKLHYFDRSPVLALYNPWTRRVRHLRSSHFDRFARQHYFTMYGLGYDSASEDYKVVEIAQLRLKKSRATRANIYSLTRNSWHEVQAYTDNFKALWPWACEVGGALHNLGWMERCETVQCPGRTIAAFQVGSEEFRFVPLPEHQQDYLDMDVAELGGCLCLACYYRLDSDYRVEVWVMKEYGVVDSWTVLVSFKLPVIEDPISLPVPLAYSVKGDMVLFNCTGTRSFWYDLTRRPDFLDLRECSKQHWWFWPCDLLPLH